jgi:hypothetical protein
VRRVKGQNKPISFWLPGTCLERCTDWQATNFIEISTAAGILLGDCCTSFSDFLYLHFLYLYSSYFLIISASAGCCRSLYKRRASNESGFGYFSINSSLMFYLKSYSIGWIMLFPFNLVGCIVNLLAPSWACMTCAVLKVYPLLPGEKHRQYNSLVNNESDPSIYVVQHTGQAYPAYLITFN